MRTVASLCLAAMLLLALGGSPPPPAQAAAPVNMLPNGSLELGAYSGPDDAPAGWERDAFDHSAELTWDETEALSGRRSFKIHAPTANDAQWRTTVQLEPNTLYRLSGWIKTEAVEHSAQSVDPGAHLNIFGTWDRSPGIFGTTDWTYVSLRFRTGESGSVSISARLGFWSGTTAGTAWFDELRITRIAGSEPAPSWKILVLIYDRTELTYTDANNVEHRLIAEISNAERERAAREATAFVTEDIPALTSGIMRPTVSIRYPGALTQLSRIGDGWWPSPADTSADRDSDFDSVIVIWDPRTVDQDTGQPVWIGTAAGLTPPMGTGQTYYAQIIESTGYGHRNVFKHEWGHAILFYFEALGASPLPIISNHAEADEYVHCPTGEPYVWIDEMAANPIPNSIYNNDSGFTHDYYSGTVATADQPTRCLGIPAAAWVIGGPASQAGYYPYYHQFSLAADHIPATAAPGATATHEIVITNTGNLTDTFSIYPADITWQLEVPANSGPIGPGETSVIPASVFIPADAMGGATVTTRLSIISSTDPNQGADLYLVTHAERRYGLQLLPDVTEQIGKPGTTLHYTLALSNTGNLTDTITLEAGGNRWPIVLPTQPIELTRAEQRTITIDVTVPQNAAAGTADTVTVVATSQGGAVQDRVTLTSRTPAPAPAPVYRIWLPQLRSIR